MRSIVVAFLVLGMMLPAGCNRAAVPAPGPTIVYVVRHAEKAADPKDPPLSPAGVVRAEALARVLEGAEIAAIYSSQTQRTESTVRPLSQKIGIPISYGTAAMDDPAAYARQLAAEVLAKHRGQNVVIVNHSNTVPVIVETLSGQAVAPMSDYEYATLFIVTIPPDGPPSVVRAQYGQQDGVAPTAPQAAALREVRPFAANPFASPAVRPGEEKRRDRVL
jgi:broad specificity phosphatase PhoE